MVRFVVFAACAVFAFSSQGYAQTTNLQEAEIRRILQTIIKKDASVAPAAQKALEALNKPETTQEGYHTRNRGEIDARRIVNGIPIRGYPAVGALLTGNDPKSAKIQCTGTLVGCDKFLTAAHCISDNPSPSGYLVFFQEAGFFRVRKIKWEPKKYKFPIFDIAMLTLEQPVEGIAPMPINTTLDQPLDGEIGTIVGFGRTGGIHYDYGVKRDGSVKKRACPPAYADKKVLCWFFDADVKSTASASNTCNADSGGGVFMRDDDGGGGTVRKVFGIVSGGKDKSCVKHDVSYNVDVFQYRDWIAAAGEGRLSSKMCGGAIGEDGAYAPRQVVLHLDAKTPAAQIVWRIPPGTHAFRVAMNGDDDGNSTNDFDLSVFRASGESPSQAVCRDDGPGQFAFCQIKNPIPGDLTIAVSRKKGEGSAQITGSYLP